MAGQIGFDEGGVLQALNTPILTREIVTEKKLKSGKIKTTTTRLEVTGAQLVALALGPALLQLFLSKLPAEEAAEFAKKYWWTAPFGLVGVGGAAVTEELQKPAFKDTGKDSRTVGEALRDLFGGVIDPIGVFR